MARNASAPQRVVAYIDGFNLYYGIRSEGRRYLWLDLVALVEKLLKPGQQLVAVRYFTARVRNDPPAEQRQETYLNALSAHSSILDVRQGRFQQKAVTCRSCGAARIQYEEKETDVSLAVTLVGDGARGLYDVALLISADSDMVPAIREVKLLVPGVRVVGALPPNRHSGALKEACDVTFTIGTAKIRQSQLPDSVSAGGSVFTRPGYWK